jgi:hypothetical protein
MRNKQQRKQAPFIDKSGLMRGKPVSEAVSMEPYGTNTMRKEREV